ncbi:TPA: hypothetical protein DEP90_03045 [Patescibacteria group bacterium]|nr:hypothetical protein [Patescibacteria group bacterium]
MAKPTKYAPLICTVVSILALIGIVVGLLTQETLVIVFLLLPAAIYEVYRTEGKSTKASSFLLLGVLIAEILLIIFKVDFNLADYFGVDTKYIGGYMVPLGDIAIVGSSLMAVLSVILFLKTYGKYTKWLAVTIFITSFGIIYSIDPGVFKELFQYAIEQGINRI